MMANKVGYDVTLKLKQLDSLDSNGVNTELHAFFLSTSEF